MCKLSIKYINRQRTLKQCALSWERGGNHSTARCCFLKIYQSYLRKELWTMSRSGFYFLMVYQHCTAQHWPAPVVDTRCGPPGLASHRGPGRLLLWRLPQGATWRRNAAGGKDRDASAAGPDQTFDCTRCGRICLSRIGLVGHQRACSRRGQPHFIDLGSRSQAKSISAQVNTYLLAVHSFCSLAKNSFSSFRLFCCMENASSSRYKKQNGRKPSGKSYARSNSPLNERISLSFHTR